MKKFLSVLFFALICTGLWSFDVGDNVMANWTGDAYWYPATIVQKEGSRFFVVFEDFDREWITADRIRAENLQVGQNVQCRWQGGDFYPGKIGRRSGKVVYINYNDGDVEWTTIDHIRTE